MARERYVLEADRAGARRRIAAAAQRLDDLVRDVRLPAKTAL
jgi:hypothetical protein